MNVARQFIAWNVSEKVARLVETIWFGSIWRRVVLRGEQNRGPEAYRSLRDGRGLGGFQAM